MKNLQNLQDKYKYNLTLKIKARGYALDHDKVFEKEELFNDYEKFKTLIRKYKKLPLSEVSIYARDNSHRSFIKQLVFSLNADNCTFNFQQA